jgi:acyl-CoA reductase-like NAD-dependent aldehyde dehydrogenase
MKDCRQFYIDGRWVDPAVASALSPKRLLPRSLSAAALMLDRAVAAAKRAFESDSDTTLGERLALLRRVLDAYKSKMDQMAESIFTRDGRSHLTFAKGTSPCRTRTLGRNRERCLTTLSSRNSRVRRSCERNLLECAASSHPGTGR